MMRYFCPLLFFFFYIFYYYYYPIDAVCVLRSKRRRHTQYIGQKYPGPWFLFFFPSLFFGFYSLFLIIIIIITSVSYFYSIILFPRSDMQSSAQIPPVGPSWL